MRLSSLLPLTLLCLGPVAWAGPTLPKGLRSEVPDAVVTANAPLATEVAGLEGRVTEAERQLEEAKGNDKTLKLEVKAADAHVDAEKATLKAAKKSKDKDAVATAKESVKAAKAAVDAAEQTFDLNGALIDLLAARVKLLGAEHDWKEAQVELAYAESVADAHPELDVSRYDQSVSKGKIAYEQARADLGTAEAKYAAKGGVIRGEAAAAAVAPAPVVDTAATPPPLPSTETPATPTPAPQ